MSPITQTLERACPVCQSPDPRPLFKKEQKFFVRCTRCGLIYQDSPSSTGEARGYYEKGYYESFGERNSPILQARFPLYENFLSQCERIRNTGRILDVGCGFGEFLKRAGERGWEGFGIEPSRQASESSQSRLGPRILNQTVEETDFPENYFDVITLWNVVDCLPDPLTALRRIHQWLAPGGLLLIRTPNSFFHWSIFRFYSAFRPFLGRMGWKKEASVFLRANFDAKSLKHLLQKTGFRNLRVQNGSPTEGDAYQVFSNESLAKWAKSSIYGLARWVDFLSGNKTLVGPNLVALASKGLLSSESRPWGIRGRIVLKRVVLHAVAVLGYLLGLPLWLRLLGKDRQIRILRYHSVGGLRGSDVSISKSQFEKQIAFLTQHDSVISLEETVKLLEEGKLPPRGGVAVTFDDGYEDNYQVAFPILQKKKLPATIFLLTMGEGLHRTFLHLAGDFPGQNRRLSWDEVREMADRGVTFGSHGQTHVRLTELSHDPLVREVAGSKEKIESEIRRPVRFFSYPYGVDGDFDRRTEFLAKEAGYQAAFSAVYGSNGLGANRFALKRIGIEASDTLFTFRAKLNGALDLLSFFDRPFVRKILRRLDSFFFGVNRPPQEKKPPFLLVSVDFPPHTDGVSTISRELSRRVTLRGEKLFVIGPRDKEDRKFDALQPYRVFRVGGYEWGYLRLFPILLCMPWVVFRHGIRKVFAMNIAYGGILSWALSHLAPLEYLIFAYGYEFEKVRKIPFLCWLYRNIYRRAQGIVTCSQLVRERLIDFGADPKKIKVIYPAVDLDRYRPLQVPEQFLDRHHLKNRKILLTVGRLIERKGHDQVLRALPTIAQKFPNVLYSIVGIGPHEGKLREEVKRLNLEKHVRFMGKVSEEELVWLYNACHVFAMPSREILEEGHIEGFGIVYLEANACGKPVIGGKSGGIAEAIRDGQTGFLVDPSRPEETAEKITFLLSHPEKAEAMGRQGLAWVRETFHWDRYTSEAYQLLSEGPVP